jgi:hypothetical protein
MYTYVVVLDNLSGANTAPKTDGLPDRAFVVQKAPLLL